MTVPSDKVASAQEQSDFLLNQIQALIDVLLANNNYKNTNMEHMKNLLLLLRAHAEALSIAHSTITGKAQDQSSNR